MDLFHKIAGKIVERHVIRGTNSFRLNIYTDLNCCVYIIYIYIGFDLFLFVFVLKMNNILIVLPNVPDTFILLENARAYIVTRARTCVYPKRKVEKSV